MKGKIEAIIAHIEQVMCESNNMPALYREIEEAYYLKISGQFQDILSDLTGDVFLEEALLSSDLIDWFSFNWTFTRHTFLGYTVRSDDPLTLLLCELAEDLSKALTDTPTIKILMPTVMYEHMDNQALDLNKKPLSEVLKTHILSDCGRFLVSVDRFLALETMRGDKIVDLSHFEIRKNAYAPLDDATADALRMNSVQGIGTEEEAGQGAMFKIMGLLGVVG